MHEQTVGLENMGKEHSWQSRTTNCYVSKNALNLNILHIQHSCCMYLQLLKGF